MTMSRARAATIALTFCLLAVALPALSARAAGPDFVAGEVLVKFRPTATAAARARVLAGLGGADKGDLPLVGAVRLGLSAMDVDEAVERFREDPAVAWIEPNYIWHADAVPDDPRFPELWGLHNTGQSGGVPDADIDAPEAWEQATGSREVLVAVIDTGLDYTHPDLAANAWTNPGEIAGNGLDDDANGYVDDVHGADFVHGDGDPQDDHGHGTHCAGTIGAVGDNGLGVVGVCWGVRIMGLKFLSWDGYGTSVGAISAIAYGVDMGARVLSCSWGGRVYSQALADAIAAAGEAGVLVVASAGNESANLDMYPQYPAAYPHDNIIAVAATTHADQLTWFSCWGAQSVDIGAPGEDILSTLPSGQYGYKDGTSMACPHVSGAAALLMARFPGMPARSARTLLLNNARPLPALAGRVATGGALNLFAAMVGPDSIPPAPIGDLAVTASGGDWVELAWTATGDDGTAGTAATYDIRYAMAPIDSLTFADATPAAGLPRPAPAGSAEAARVGDLEFGTTYWFAVRARDEYGLGSPVVSTVSATTPPPPVISVAPDSLTVTVMPGAIAGRTLAIGNSGASELAWSIATQWATGTASFTLAPPLPEAQPAPEPAAKAAPVTRRPAEPVRRTGAQVATLADLDGVVILWDLAHGQETHSWYHSYIIDALRNRGAQVYENSAPLTEAELTGIDLLWIREMYTPFAAAEIEGIVRWLQSGGGLLFEGDESPAWFNELLAAAEAGVALGAQAYAGVTTLVADHPTTAGITSLAIGNPLTGLADIVSPAGRLVSDFLENPVVAWSEVGRGRLVVSCDEIMDDYTIALEQNSLFTHQVVDWLVGEPWLECTPGAGVVPAGSVQEVAVAFHAGAACNADLSARLAVRSNDPATPEVLVAARMIVPDAPDIGIPRAGIDWGRRFTGATMVDTLMVTNSGCGPLAVASITAGSPEVSVVPAGPFTLEASMSRMLIVTWAPITAGALADTLVVASDDTDEPRLMVYLSGVATEPPVMVVAPTAIDVELPRFGTAQRTVRIENLGVAPLEWEVDTDIVPAAGEAAKSRRRALFLLTGGTAGDAHAPALRRLDWQYETVFAWSTFAARLVDGGPWDVVIVSNHTTTPTNAQLDLVLAHVDAGGALLYSDGNLSAYASHALLARLGIRDPITLVAPENVLPIDASDPCFTQPNGIGELGWTLNRRYVDGHSVTVRNGALRLASFQLHPTQAAIVLGGNGATIFNGFQVDNYMADSDADGIPDAVELVENELLLIDRAPSWLAVEPRRGTVSAGAACDLTLMYRVPDACGAQFAARLEITGNDPVHPQLDVALSLAVGDSADIAATPDWMDFGTLFVGQATPDTLMVINEGCRPLVVSGLAAAPAAFGVLTPVPFTLEAGASRPVVVTCRPETEGRLDGTLVLHSNDPDEPALVVPLLAGGTLPPVLGLSDEAVSFAVPHAGTGGTRVTISNSGHADLRWSAAKATDVRQLPRILVLTDVTYVSTNAFTRALTALELGYDVAASWGELMTKLRDAGPWDLVIVDAHYYGPTSAGLEMLAAHLDGGGALIFGDDALGSTYPTHRLATELGVRFEFSFAGTAPFSALQSDRRLFQQPNELAAWTTTTNPRTGVPQVWTARTGARRLAAFNAYPQSGAIIRNASGKALFNAFRSESYNADVDNDGVSDMVELAENEIALLGFAERWLSVQPVEGVVPAGGSQDLVILGDASALCAGTREGRVILATNDPQRRQVVLRATMSVADGGVLAAEPGTLDFGPAMVNGRRPATLTVYNEGCEPTTVAGATCEGDGFSVAPFAPAVLSPGNSLALKLDFRPMAMGLATGTVTVRRGDPHESPLVVALVGTGVSAPRLEADLDSLHVAARPGEIVNATVALSNTGEGPLRWYANETVAMPDTGYTAAGAAPKRTPRVLLMVDCNASNNAYVHALRRLGYDWVLKGDWFSACNALIDDGPWDLAIVESFAYTGSLHPRFLDVLASIDVPVIFASGELSTYASHPLLQRLGVNFISNITVPRGLVALDSEHPCFTRPNAVTELGKVSNQYDVDGQVVSVREDAVTLATLVDGPASPAIVYNPGRRAIFNSFLTCNFSLDADEDGVTDVAEIAENEIALLAHDGSWLAVSPAFGVLQPGQRQDLALTLDARGRCGTTLRSAIVLATNDPLAWSAPIPVTMRTAGEAQLTLSRAALAFGECFVGGARSDTLMIGNNGCIPLVIRALESAEADFSATPATPFSIDPGDSVVLEVTYRPAAAGPQATSLAIDNDGPEGQPRTVSLAGVGVMPPVIGLEPSQLAVTLPHAGSARRMLTIGNSGPHSLTWVANVFSADSVRVLATMPPLAGSGNAGAKGPETAGAPPPGPDDGDLSDLREWRYEGDEAPTTKTAVTPSLEEVLARLDAGHAAISHLVPDRFDFTDGISGQLISDGGDDMYDAGNVLYTSLGGPANYRDGQITESASVFGLGSRYFTRKYPGLFVLAADVEAIDWFRVTGGLGADGAGWLDGATLEVAVNGGQRLLGLVKRVYGTSDPSVNHIVIVESRSGVAQQFGSSTDTDYHNVTGLRSQTRLYYLLYASADGGYVDNGATKAILRRFLETIGLGLGWLGVEPSSGTVAPGAVQEVAIDFAADTIGAGDHAAHIVVESNDPLRPALPVEALLRVLAQPGALALDVEAVQAGGSSGLLRLGVDGGASDGFDAGLDLPVDPPPTGAPSAWFSHPDWAVGDGRFRTDQRAAFDLEAAHKTWVLEVASAGPGPVTLITTNASPLPLATRLLLLDEQAGVVHDLAAEPTYTYAAAASGTRRFAVRVGTGLPPREPDSRSLAAGWSLVGLPVWPAPGQSLADVLLAGAPAGSWLYAWNAANASYDVVDPAGQAAAGAGFWFYGAGPFTLAAAGGLALADVEMPLAAGWTLVGYPLWFAGDLAGASVLHGGARFPFDEAVSAGLLAPVAFERSAAGNYAPTTALAPWHAYWVASYVEGASLVFAHEAMAAAAAAPAVPAAKEQAGDWTLALRLGDGGPEVVIGQAAGATDGLDPRLDLPAAPRAPDTMGADIRLPRPAWTTARGLDFVSDIRPAGTADLVFTALVTGASGDHRLSWSASTLPPGRDLKLSVGGRTLVASLRAQDAVEIRLGQAPMLLEISTTEAGDQAPPAAVGPQLRNRPNPFNPTTEVLFNLPAAGRASVGIYDTRGVLVRRLDGGRLEAGPASLTWDGLDARGQRAGSGVYVYRLEFEGRQLGGTRKMVLLK